MSTTAIPTQSRGSLKASYLLRISPRQKAELEAKARAYAARTGEPMTLAAALRQGAARYLDELLAEPPPR